MAQRDHCEPLTDELAAETARSFGLPAFNGTETGTTVTIIEPNLLDPAVPEEEAAQLPPEEAGRFIAEAMAWNLWPLTLQDRAQRLRLRLTVDGRDVSIPNESSDPVLAHFAAAYRRMKSEDGEAVDCKRPKRRLGSMAIERTFGARVRAGAAADLGLVEDVAEGEAPHHVCLMRRPELVVRYQSGPMPQHPDVGYVGVLRVDDDLDPTFAKSEPPTHDAWIDSQLHGAEATYVRVVHRRIRERCDEIAGARRSRVVVEGRPAGGIARKLGHLLSGASPTGTGVGAPSPLPTATNGAAPARAGFSSSAAGAPGAGTGRGTGRSVGPRGPGRPRLEGVPRFVDGPDGTLLEQSVRLPGRGSFTASVKVVTGDGQLETDPYVGAPMPIVLGWIVDGARTAGEVVSVAGPCEAVILVRPIADAMVDISVGSDS